MSDQPDEFPRSDYIELCANTLTFCDGIADAEIGPGDIARIAFYEEQRSMCEAQINRHIMLRLAIPRAVLPGILDRLSAVLDGRAAPPPAWASQCIGGRS